MSDTTDMSDINTRAIRRATEVIEAATLANLRLKQRILDLEDTVKSLESRLSWVRGDLEDSNRELAMWKGVATLARENVSLSRAG